MWLHIIIFFAMDEFHYGKLRWTASFWLSSAYIHLKQIAYTKGTFCWGAKLAKWGAHQVGWGPSSGLGGPSSGLGGHGPLVSMLKKALAQAIQYFSYEKLLFYIRYHKPGVFNML